MSKNSISEPGKPPANHKPGSGKKVARGTGETPEKIPADPAPGAQKKWLPHVLAAGLTAIAGIAIMPLLGQVGMAGGKETSTLGKWIAFLGEFHPLFLHLPIGALMLVMVMEACRVISLGKYQPRTTLALAFASGMAVFAAVFGYFLYLTGEFPHGAEGELTEEHKRDGIIFTLLLITTFIVRYCADALPRARALKPAYALGLLFTTAAMISASHHGGKITHGDPLEKAPWLEKERETRSSADIADPIVYQHIIHPILEHKCNSCHGDKKQKGGLRMDSYAALLKGGDEQSDTEKCLIPGDLENSMMISYLHFPLDDDLRMPPEGKTQLTAEEIQALEWWVESGASETARKSAFDITPALARALASLMSPEERAMEKAAAEKEKQDGEEPLQ